MLFLKTGNSFMEVANMKKLKKLACFFLCICLICGLSATAFGAEAMDTRILATVNKPGVVLVQTQWTADITWYEFSFEIGRAHV